MVQFVQFVFLLSVCWQFSLCANDPQPCILQKKGLQEFLREAGISDGTVKNYSHIFTSKNIDANVLKELTLAQLQSLGVNVPGDRLKIQKYFAGDMCNNCAKGNFCQNGGVCRDGFRCFRCSCPNTFYGPTCSSKCPCKNYGKCLETDGGYTCKCLAGYTGKLCEKQWLSEKAFVELEEKVERLVKKLVQSEKKMSEQGKDIATLKAKLTMSNVSKHEWRLVRVDKELNLLSRIALHLKTPTIIQKMPMTFPQNTRAIIISVFTNFWNGKGHVYLNFLTYQQGNANEGSAAVVNEHYSVPANTWYYEIMLPWYTTLPQELVFKMTNTYMTGGNKNWYKVKLVGYVTA